MSTVKSSSEDLTLNADGSGNDVVIQSNGATTATVTATGVDVTGGVATTTSIDVSGTDSKLNLTATNTGADHSINAASSVGALAIDVDANSEGSDARLVVNMRGSEAMRIDASSNLKFNSGYGSAATAYGCRAWVKFNGTGTVAIYNSANVSSITDLGTGRYRVNFTTAMVDADFAAVTSNANRDGGCYGHSTTDVGVFAGESAVDSTIISVAIFR